MNSKIEKKISLLCFNSAALWSFKFKYWAIIFFAPMLLGVLCGFFFILGYLNYLRESQNLAEAPIRDLSGADLTPILFCSVLSLIYVLASLGLTFVVGKLAQSGQNSWKKWFFYSQLPDALIIDTSEELRNKSKKANKNGKINLYVRGVILVLFILLLLYTLV